MKVFRYTSHNTIKASNQELEIIAKLAADQAVLCDMMLHEKITAVQFDELKSNYDKLLSIHNSIVNATKIKS